MRREQMELVEQLDREAVDHIYERELKRRHRRQRVQSLDDGQLSVDGQLFMDERCLMSTQVHMDADQNVCIQIDGLFTVKVDRKKAGYCIEVLRGVQGDPDTLATCKLWNCDLEIDSDHGYIGKREEERS